jgi:3-phenylpropionate/trans-cinnamate dioxygenase ferredoxin reductase subunit
VSTPRSIVIVGAGLAGGHAALTLRELGYDGRLTLVGAEVNPPYSRPPLSKQYLRGEKAAAKLFLRPADAYADQHIELVLGRRAASIQRHERFVVLDNGSLLAYDRLVLATGSRPAHLDVPGSRLEGVHYLRTLEDADAIATEASQIESVAVIGGGWIGSEVAASLRQMGKDVTLIGADPLPLQRVLGREVAGAYADVHRANGVRLVSGRVVGLHGRERVEAVDLTDGTRITAQAVVAGIGAKADLRLATEAGLATADGGIAVDQFLRSGDTDIYVAGDLAAAWHPIYGRRLRVEHWDNAIEQGKLVARNILGEAVPYERRPYFYSDQFDLGMEYRGLAVDVDDVVISGDIGSREFCAFWLHEDRIVSAMNANVWDVGDQLQSLVETQPLVDRARLAREGAQIALPVAAAAA